MALFRDLKTTEPGIRLQPPARPAAYGPPCLSRRYYPPLGAAPRMLW